MLIIIIYGIYIALNLVKKTNKSKRLPSIIYRHATLLKHNEQRISKLREHTGKHHIHKTQGTYWGNTTSTKLREHTGKHHIHKTQGTYWETPHPQNSGNILGNTTST